MSMCNTENWHGLSNLWGNWHNFEKKKKEKEKLLVNWVLHNGINLVDCHINCAAECKLITTSVWFKRRMKETEGKRKKKKERYFLHLLDYFFILKYLSFFCSWGSSGKQGWCTFAMSTTWVVFFPSPALHSKGKERKKWIVYPGICKTPSKQWHIYMRLTETQADQQSQSNFRCFTALISPTASSSAYPPLWGSHTWHWDPYRINPDTLVLPASPPITASAPFLWKPRETLEKEASIRRLFCGWYRLSLQRYGMKEWNKPPYRLSHCVLGKGTANRGCTCTWHIT